MRARVLGCLQSVPQRARTLILMMLGVALVAAAGLWDAQHQADEELHRLIRERHLLATALATRFDGDDVWSSNLEQRSAALAKLLGMARLLEAQGNVVTMLHTPDQPGFVLADGRVFASDPLLDALRKGSEGVTLSREDASTLGLGHRVAVAGVAEVGQTSPSRAGIVVVGSARQERDHARRDEWRTVITTLLVSALILGFGGIALRRQRRELELERQVAVHRSERERDVELARADRMAAMAAMSSGIAHEISTPLGIISGRLDEMRAQSWSNTELERLLASASQQVERINKVIRGFLALARGDAPTLTLASATQLANEAAQLVRHRFAVAGVELRTDLGGVGGSLVACEPALFEQVLVNLLINALEASERGQFVELKVEHRGQEVLFVVLDNGEGIPPTAVAHVTEPFFTTKARKGGSGLGLAIAKEIVAHHNGKLSLERRATSAATTQGTRATVMLAATV